MNVHDHIKKWLVYTLDIEKDREGDFVVEYPSDTSHGDFATNVVMVLAKKEKKNPKELAELFVEKLKAAQLPEIKDISVAGPGFINLTLKPELYADVVGKVILMGHHFGNHTRLSGQRIIAEYTTPNPFKEFHIGHMMDNIIGESISRILESHGTEVVRVTYHGDVGLHVAKAIWGLQSMEVGTEIDVKVLGKAYALGSSLFETNEEAKKEIVVLNKKIYERSDTEVNALYEKGLAVSLRYFEEMYRRLGSLFNYHFYESDSGPIGKKLVLEFVETGVFEKSEGAVIFRGEKYGLHTRVFLNAEGLPTYEAKEIGLMQIKKDLLAPFDLSITVTANEQDSTFAVTEKAIYEVFPDLNGKLLHLSHGMMKTQNGKISSRTGGVPTADAMIDQVKEAARLKIKPGVHSDEQQDQIAEMVALAALKFSILRQAIGGDIVFDLEKALSFEGDSGPYLQYACVRASTLMKKAEGVVAESHVLPIDWQTTNLERLLQRYPHVVDRAGKEYAPHHIVTYLTQLASEFNFFYSSHKIIDVTDPTSPYRLALTHAFVLIMQSGLQLLGIQIPEEM